MSVLSWSVVFETVSIGACLAGLTWEKAQAFLIDDTLTNYNYSAGDTMVITLNNTNRAYETDAPASVYSPYAVIIYLITKQHCGARQVSTNKA